MGFEDDVEREQARYEDGLARLDAGQLVRIGNAAYGAGLALLMLGRREEAAEWLGRAALRWRESWEQAAPGAWGRPIGAIKASLLAEGAGEAARYSAWALGLGCVEADSPIGRYAGTLALLVLGRGEEAAACAATLTARDDFPAEVAAALAAIAGADPSAYAAAAERVLVSFEVREHHLEGVAVADTFLVLEELARSRGLRSAMRPSALLPTPQAWEPAASGST